jgi:type I restriction enzyme S subunit
MKAGWQTSTLGDVLSVIRNGVNCKQDKSGNGDRISRIESISDATFDSDKVGYAELSERDKEKNRLQPGDILFSHINSAVHVGKTAVFDCDEPVYHGVNLLLMRPKEVVTSAYLDHALKYLFQSGYWLGVCKQSVNQASVNQQDISRVEIRYPKSLAEQQRIVALLDEAFAGLATAKANTERNLQNARAIFESHLQSVFSHRGEGWVKTVVQSIAKPGKGKIRTGPFGSQLLHSEFVDEGIAVLGIDNAVANHFQWGKSRFITPEKYQQLERYTVYPGDVLITIMGTCGRCAVVPDDIPLAINTKHICCITLDRGQCLPGYLHIYFLHAPQSQEYLAKYAKGAIMAGLNMGLIQDLPVSLPPLQVQEELIGVADDLREETQRLTRLYERKLTALEELKKSLLHQVFNGEL